MSLIAGNLSVVQRMLDETSIKWGVCAGAAAHVYGNRRPINNIDVLVEPGTLREVSSLLQRTHKAVQFDSARILWRGIKIIDDMSVQLNGTLHGLKLDDSMAAHCQRKPLLGAKVLLLAPEDVLVQKLLLEEATNGGAHSSSDVDGIIKRQTLDLAYLRQRLSSAHAHAVVAAALERRGITVEHPVVQP